MLVRLKVKGFKNLADVEVRFGSFTCIAGANGVGKSNLFDAIKFLSALAGKTLVEAAFSVREGQNQNRSAAEIRNLFFFDGKQHASSMEFEADMITPLTATDHLGQLAEATTTALRYRLVLGYRNGQQKISQSPLEIIREELSAIRKSDMTKALVEMGAANPWMDGVLKGTRRNSVPFIATDEQAQKVFVHADQVQGGSKKTLKINQLPRTILSSANAVENPTMLVAKREMESWQLLQLEPSALRSPDDIAFSEVPKIQFDGRHLPATLYRLMHDKSIAYDVKSQIASRLSELVHDVFQIEIDRDEKKDILTLVVTGFMPARSLSDGTLRFLALSVMEADPEVQGVICLEEPENGIHPRRIKSIIKLLEDIAVDPKKAAGEDNPLRQVIVNTHSPLVVSEVEEGSLLFAKLERHRSGSSCLMFLPLPDTWRASLDVRQVIQKASLLAYLNPYRFPEENGENGSEATSRRTSRRIIGRPDVRQLTLFADAH